MIHQVHQWLLPSSRYTPQAYATNIIIYKQYIVAAGAWKLNSLPPAASQHRDQLNAFFPMSFFGVS